MKWNRYARRLSVGLVVLMLQPFAHASVDAVQNRPKRVVINDAQLEYLAGFPNGFPDSVLGPLAGEKMPDAMPGVEAQIRRVSQATPFLPVGSLWMQNRLCTGTWLGQQGRFTYILTAAHCAGDRKKTLSRVNAEFLGWDGAVLASGEGWSHKPEAYVSSEVGFLGVKPGPDIAILQLPTLETPKDPGGKPLAQPLIYDGDKESDHPGDFVGYGLWNDGQTSGRRWGRNDFGWIHSDRIGAYFDHEKRTDHWARTNSGDSGGAVWQPQSGYWSIVGTLVGQNGRGDTYASRVSSHLAWLRQVFPGLKTLSDRLTVTAFEPFVSRDFSRSVDQGGVYFTVPSQVSATGPSVRRSGGERGPSRISVDVLNDSTQQKVRIWLRGERIDGDKKRLPMEDVSDAGTAAGQLSLSFHPEDNPDLPIGRYHGTFDVEASGAIATTFVQRFPVHVRVSRWEGLVTLHRSYQGPVAGGGKAYYTTSTPMVDMKSRHTHQGPGPQWAWAKVFSVPGGVQHAVRLRVLHDSDCETEQFQKESGCRGHYGGRLTVSFHPVDQAGQALPPGLYRGTTQFVAHKPEDGAPLETINLKIDLDTRVTAR